MMWSHEARRKDLPPHIRELLRQNARVRISPISYALAAFVACPLLSLVADVASLVLLLAWFIAPIWAFVSVLRANRKEDADIIAIGAHYDQVWVASFPGEPGCSVISELRDSMEMERSRGMVVAAIPRKEATRRMNQYLEWINEQRRERGKETL